MNVTTAAAPLERDHRDDLPLTGVCHILKHAEEVASGSVDFGVRLVVAAELGEWARGYALDQQLSGAKARRELGWSPTHLDPEGEIARLS